MSQPDSTTVIKGGEIITKQTKKGIEFSAFNFQRNKTIPIGTVIGSVFEKVANVLQKPEPSFTLTQHELAAVLQSGAAYLRIILPRRGGTYVISVADFKQHKEKYFHREYGYQWRVSLTRFRYSPKVQQRNAILDNPPAPVERDIIAERRNALQQMPLFGGHGGSSSNAGPLQRSGRGGR